MTNRIGSSSNGEERNLSPLSHCESKDNPNHDCKHKSWNVLLLDKDKSNDNTILIVYDEWWKKEIDLIKTLDSDKKSTSSNKVIKLTMDQDMKLTEFGVMLVEYDD